MGTGPLPLTALGHLLAAVNLPCANKSPKSRYVGIESEKGGARGRNRTGTVYYTEGF